jgi:hypothetical protein
MVQQLAEPQHRIDLASDCQNVVKDCALPFRVAAGAKRMYAGITREVRLDDNWKGYVTARKVKAHVSPEHAETESLRQDAIGNNWADLEAKRAVALHPAPSPSAITDLEAMLKRSKLVVRTIAAVTQAFPPLPKERMARPPAAREGSSHKTTGGHAWCYTNGFWRCSCCLKMTMAQQLDSDHVTQQCPGPKPSMQLEAMTARGHVLARTVASMPIVFCTRCGAFTARRAYGLAAPCRGTPTPPRCAGACAHQARPAAVAGALGGQQEEDTHHHRGLVPRQGRVRPAGPHGTQSQEEEEARGYARR